MKQKFKINETKASVLGSIFASLGAILASSCCIIPIVFFNLGIGGAWLANLAVLQSYRVHFISVAALLFVVGVFFYSRSFKRNTEACPLDRRKNLWAMATLTVSVILIAVAMIWPEVEPYLLRTIQ